MKYHVTRVRKQLKSRRNLQTSRQPFQQPQFRKRAGLAGRAKRGTF